jgi:hypothetical protein
MCCASILQTVQYSDIAEHVQTVQDLRLYAGREDVAVGLLGSKAM